MRIAIRVPRRVLQASPVLRSRALSEPKRPLPKPQLTKLSHAETFAYFGSLPDHGTNEPADGAADHRGWAFVKGFNLSKPEKGRIVNNVASDSLVMVT